MHAYVPSRPSCPAHAHTPTHARPQHTGINDRFVYGAASIIRDYIRRRWTRLHASHINDLPLPPILASVWKLSSPPAYPDCLFAESLACWYLLHTNTSVGFTRAKVRM